MDINQMHKSQYISELRSSVLECEAMRKDPDNPQDISLAAYAKERWAISMEDLYADLGINPSTDTIENIINMPNPEARWLLPEIYRDAFRLGMRRAPIHNGLIAAEQTVKGLEITQPAINMSDATPLYTGIAETIRLGDVSFAQKTVKLRKLARGIKLPYEVRNFVSLDVVSIFLQDFGIKLGQGLDSLAIHTLINGDQANGSNAAAVVGIDTPNTMKYRDLLRVYLRMSRLGRFPNVMVGGEEMGLDILDMDAFKKRESGTTQAKLNIKTPVPSSSDFYLHSAVNEDQVLVLDPSLAMVKYNAQPLMVESEKIVSNQTDAVYASLITGFGIVFEDARIIIDRTEDFEQQGFPSYLDPLTAEAVHFSK